MPTQEFPIAVRKEVTIGLSHHLGLDRPIPEGTRPDEDWQRPVRMTLAYRDERGHDTPVTEWDERIIWGKGMGVETLVRSIESAACKDAAFQFNGDCIYVLTFHGKDNPYKSRLMFKIPGGQEVAHLARSAGFDGAGGLKREESGIAERLMPDILRYVQGKEEMLMTREKMLFETLIKSNQNYAKIIQEATDRELKVREIELNASDHHYQREKERRDEATSEQMKKDAWELVKKNGPKLIPHLVSALQRLGGGRGPGILELEQIQAWGQQEEGREVAEATGESGANGVSGANGANGHKKPRRGKKSPEGAEVKAGEGAEGAGEPPLIKQLELRVAFDVSRFVMLVRGRGQEKIIIEALSEDQKKLWDAIASAAMADLSEESSEALARYALEFGGAVQADPEIGFKLLGELDEYSKIALVELSKVLEVYQAELVKAGTGVAAGIAEGSSKE